MTPDRGLILPSHDLVMPWDEGFYDKLQARPSFKRSRGGSQFVPVTVRHVGNYAFTFSAETTKNITVLGADLGPANPKKQLIFVNTMLSALMTRGGVASGATSVTFGGNAVNYLPTFTSDISATAFGAYTIPFTGAGDTTLAITFSSTITEVGTIAVYEVINAAPLKYCPLNIMDRGTSASIALRRPKNSCIIAWAIADDATTHTWGGITEQQDVDGGDGRIVIAGEFTPVSADTNTTMTLTPSTGNVNMCSMIILHESYTGPMIKYGWNTSVAAGATSTLNNLSLPGMTDCTLLLFLYSEQNATISAITFDGNSIASNLVFLAESTSPTPDLHIYCYAIPLDSSGLPNGSLVITQTGTTAGSWWVNGFFVKNGVVGTPVTDVDVGSTTVNLNTNVQEGGGIIGCVASGAAGGVPNAWTGLGCNTAGDFAAMRLGLGFSPILAAESPRTVSVNSASGSTIGASLPINPV